MPRGRPKKTVEKKTPVVRMTAVRWVADKYGEKGLRALRAMGPEFAKALQDEIQMGRKRDELMARKDRAEKYLKMVADLLAKIDGEALQGGSCVPRLEQIIAAIPDIVEKIKEEKPPVEPSIPEDAVEVSAPQG
jgi:hypothetical protein